MYLDGTGEKALGRLVTSRSWVRVLPPLLGKKGLREIILEGLVWVYELLRELHRSEGCVPLYRVSEMRMALVDLQVPLVAESALFCASLLAARVSDQFRDRAAAPANVTPCCCPGPGDCGPDYVVMRARGSGRWWTE